MAETALDRSLLFGVIALQMELISGDALFAAIQDWVLNGQKSLDRILVDRGVLGEDERALLEPLVGKHLLPNSDDSGRSLAAA